MTRSAAGQAQFHPQGTNAPRHLARPGQSLGRSQWKAALCRQSAGLDNPAGYQMRCLEFPAAQGMQLTAQESNNALKNALLLQQAVNDSIGTLNRDEYGKLKAEHSG